jgi:hypothetical protein
MQASGFRESLARLEILRDACMQKDFGFLTGGRRRKGF